MHQFVILGFVIAIAAGFATSAFGPFGGLAAGVGVLIIAWKAVELS